MIKRPVKKLYLKSKEDSQPLSSRRQIIFLFVLRSRVSTQDSHRDAKDKDVDMDSLSYYELLNAFISSGCFKFQKSVDNTNNLVNKFRQQLKKKNIAVEKAYKMYDPDDHKFVFKHDFVNESLMMGLEFTEEELVKIFEYICQVGFTKGTDSTDQQKQQIDRKTQKATTRFTFKQLHDAVLVKRDENWIFQSFIKIHGMVLQKNLSYKRLFTQWREKGTKTAAGRLSAKELKAGLKKLRAGLTQDEIEKLISSVPFEGKDSSIAAQEFERIVVQGAKKLEMEKSYEKLIIQEWITTFNFALEKQQIPLERVFSEHDTQQKGSLSFEEFALLNEFVGMNIPKKELKKVFDIIDRTKNNRVRLEEVKSISSLLENEEDQYYLNLKIISNLYKMNISISQQQNDEDIENSKLQGEELKTRQELDDLYETVKDKLEKKNTTLEAIIYDTLKYMPNQFANIKGIQQLFEKLGIILNINKSVFIINNLNQNEANKVIVDVRKANHGRYECSFKEFLDYMTRKRINVAFFDKGFVDPLIAQCCQQLNKMINFYDITIEKLFDVFDKERDGKISKEVFIKCMQGMDLGISIEDLIEFFNLFVNLIIIWLKFKISQHINNYNYLDDRNENAIVRLQFVDGITFVTNKIGGGSKLEQALSSGVQQVKKGSSVKQQVFNVLKKIADGIQAKRLSMRQVLALFDTERTGFVSRAQNQQILIN